MEKSLKIINLIILIRLIIFFLLFITIVLLKLVFNGPFQKEFLLNVTLFVLFFSIFIFIASKTINIKYTFYLNPIFDTFILTFLVVNTGLINSPFMIFYPIIIFYMGLTDGKFGGIFEIVTIIISFIVFDLLMPNINLKEIINYNSFYMLTQYTVSFLIILVLSIYLHISNKSKAVEKQNIEERLKSLKNLYENIIQSISIGILLLSDSNRILSCNKAASKILNEEEKKIVGKRIGDFFPFLDKQDVCVYKNKFIGYKLQDFYFYEDKMKGKLLIFQDVTDKEMLKRELERQEKLATIGTFSSVIAHEIKNPLGAINGSFQMLKKKIKTDEKLTNIIEREMNRLNLVLNNLLYVSKPATKSNEIINVNKIINDFIESMKHYEMFDEMIFSVHYETNLNSIISEYEIKQIFWNLFLNTYEIKPDANVEISIVNKEKQTILKYSDDGPGIDSDVISDVTQPFFTTKKSGTGLGLYVIKMICDKYNISNNLYSNKEFKGFKMEFIFKTI
jgi:two-component system sensor histidine kinase PilS (NtrC family)